MVCFACDILFQMQTLTHELETELGPDTGDLALRTGIHSGAVTGKCEKSTACTRNTVTNITLFSHSRKSWYLTRPESPIPIVSTIVSCLM